METTYRSQPSTSVLIPNRFDSKQRNAHNTYRTDAPLEIPPSPTLTNPDMILPDDGERQSLTPSPPFQLTPSDTDLLQNGLQPQGGNGNYPSNGSTYRAPRPRWTYEGHAHGRPLSDIGEEDSQPSHASFEGIRTSKVYHKRSETDSVSSGSTISASSQQRLNNNAESSTASEIGLDSKRNSYASQTSIEHARAEANDALVSGTSQQTGEDTPSAILSSEAERILENAKRRLTLMEGNLTRARSSIRLGQSPSPSPSPPGHLLPTRNLQPAGELYRSISQTDRRGSLLRPRPVYVNTQEGGHSRGHSETNLPSAASLNPPALQPSRSMSALASPSALHYDSRERSFPYNAADSNGNIQSASIHNQSSQDFSRENDHHRPSYQSSDVNGSAGLGISTSKTVPKMSSMEDFNSAYPPNEPPSRAQSQLQVRDLKDQAAGLRTKVALLKVKTQEDNLRRRSLQSLRTPSPFTAAEQWYSSALAHTNGNSPLHNNAGYGWIPETTAKQQKNEQSVGNDTEEFTVHSPAERQTAGFTTEMSLPMDEGFAFETDEISVLESHYEDAEEGDYDDGEIDREALDEILNEPLDEDNDDGTSDIFEDFPSATAPEATPHEEREDAFDYENFYLHSALGTFSRSKVRRSSFGSTGSTETTRPAQDQRPAGHGRSDSGDSVSTFATFATATENAYDDAYDDDQDDALQAIDQVVDDWDEYEEDEDDEDGSTPVQSRRTTVTYRGDETRHLGTATRDNGVLTPTTPLPSTPSARGLGRDISTPTTPVDAFMSSLSRSTSARPPSSLRADDTRLLEQVFESLGKVCAELQELTMADSSIADDNTTNESNNAIPAADPKYIRTLRRRLDAARRVLDGQLDSDA